jgi:hypothetical protein
MRIYFFFFFFKSALLIASNSSVSLCIEPINEIALQTIPSISLPPKSIASTYTCKGSYSITTNEDGKRITASINSPLPKGATLSIKLEPPSGASSLGSVSISSQETSLVSNISKVAESNLEITYTITSSESCLAGSYLNMITVSLSD